jgi:hypothetical protein
MAKKTDGAAAPTLREIADDIRVWSDTLDSLDEGADEQQKAEVMSRLAASITAGRDKAESFGRFVKWLPDEAGRLKAEAERIRIKAKILEAIEQRLREYALNAMKDADTAMIEGHTFKLRSQGTGGKVIIDDEAAIPSKYKRLVVWVNAAIFEQVTRIVLAAEGLTEERFADSIMSSFELKQADIQKSAIEAAVKAGAEVPGADLDLSAKCLVIR